ncbi:MAG: hypothetical protein K2N48_01295 [Muribaculaceae bacterium]|nr:hypothetical protein [Muribaculaceae bacterium]
MKLVKTNERWDRPFENGQEGTSKLESVQFNVTDSEGNSVGSANVGQYNGNANVTIPEVGHADININGYSSIEKGEELLKAAMGITE